jgi:hypothetical protein
MTDFKADDMVVTDGGSFGSLYVAHSPMKKYGQDGWQLSPVRTGDASSGFGMTTWYPTNRISKADMATWDYDARSNTFRKIRKKPENA